MGLLEMLGGGVKYIQDQFDWFNQFNLRNQQYQREDTAIQRRVADLKAAGLSPVLAAGSAAQSSAPIRVGPAPNGAEIALDVRARQAQVAQTEAQTELIQAQAQNLRDQNPVQWEQSIDGDGTVRLDGIRLLKKKAETEYNILQEKLAQAKTQTERVEIERRLALIEETMKNLDVKYYEIDKIFKYGGQAVNSVVNALGTFLGPKKIRRR